MKHNFYIGQNLLWITEDFEGKHITKAFITEIHSDHALARTAGNGNGSDDLTLWIDDFNEMDFFDADIMKKL